MASVQPPGLIPAAALQTGGLPISLNAGGSVQAGPFGKVLSALLDGGQLPAFAQPPVQPAVQQESSAEEAPPSLPEAGLPDALLALAAQTGMVHGGPVQGGIPADPQAALAPLSGDLAMPAVAFGPLQPVPESRSGTPIGTVAPEEAAGPAADQAWPAELAGGRQILPDGLSAQEAASVQLSDGAGQPDGAKPAAGPLAADAPLRQPPVQTDGQLALHAAERAHDLTRAPAPVRESLSVHTPLRAQGWDGEFSQRIVWMAGRQTQWAEISLNPPNLGSVEVRLSMNGNEAGAQFFSPQSAVREAIEAGMPRLREMLASAGITLGEAQVSAESFSDRRERQASGHGGAFPAQENLDQPLLRVARGMVDLYV